ncbi:hypothetical protein MUK70_11680 [Dyadobacter chenwenxiniae]|uniref:Uncharacterized protein n=1 Tax=Dyadobacter chenwenxiniae TaxID=2906456 RepID=A0A9X1PIC4_9BACT|nr:hypothetical protein [Dyadobacter chenwenxiniae]MCF0059901.1 hypothetical protein [Dyadobacter chenwenxiniae]UON85640.1 hypothetical protein MUK70_11680 [Dyadobacter chenwenxiniae]
MSTKIQINSLEALNRLIGGDSELEVEVRNSVVQDFTKKHLKSMVPAVVETCLSDLQKFARPIIESTFFSKVKDGWYTKIVPNELTNKIKKDEIERIFSEEIRAIVREAADKAIKDVLTPEYIKKRLEMNIEDQVAERARQIVRAKLSGL